jgi:hypothetical protein
MSWLIGLIVTVVLLVLLGNFPKQTLGCLGVAVGGSVLLVYVVVIVPEQKRNRLEQQVTVQVTYNTQACSKEYPLLISVENTSPKAGTHIRWRVEVYRPGYSSNLAGYNNDYETDKIIGPRERWSACYVLPRTLDQQNREINTFVYRVADKYSRFAD